ncbi:MAG: cystathionine gamma-synthase [Rhizobiales bacterium]|nr:cystathionine gamma-synthase [Hyphomicrobiales bacterium]
MGDNRRGPRTLAIHAGEAPDPTTGASSPSLVLSSTFLADPDAGFSAHADGATEADGFIYGRWGNPTVQQLERKLAALEGGEAARCFASGMAASSAVLLTVLSAGDHLVVSDTNYAGTAELVRHTLPRFGVAVSPVDTSDPQAIAAAMRPETRLVWIETPANPILRLTDIAAAAGIAHDGGAKLAVDSTFATPIATRPLDLGADYVVHSLTKYICGHGDALGGAVVGGREAIAALDLEAVIHHGGILSPFNALMIMRGAATLPLRMAAHEAGALTVARWLEGDPRVARVNYPGLESHPQHDLARRQMANFSGMISFQVEVPGPQARRRMADRLEIVHYAVSLGHHRSLIYWIGTDQIMESSLGLTGRALESYREFAGDGVFRLSVGLEDPDDIIADLDGAL